MKKTFFLIILISSVLFMFNCGMSPEEAYKEADQKGTISAYEDFIKKYPDSNLRNEAEVKLKQKKDSETLEQEKRINAENSVQLENQSCEYNTSSYKDPDIEEYTVHGDTVTKLVYEGTKRTKVYGVTIKGYISNKFKVRKVSVKVNIRAMSEKGEYGMAFGYEKWGEKEINDSFIKEVPPGGITFSKYYDLTTEIKPRVPPPSFMNYKYERKGTFLKAPPRITLTIQ